MSIDFCQRDAVELRSFLTQTIDVDCMLRNKKLRVFSFCINFPWMYVHIDSVMGDRVGTICVYPGAGAADSLHTYHIAVNPTWSYGCRAADAA